MKTILLFLFLVLIQGCGVPKEQKIVGLNSSQKVIEFKELALNIEVSWLETPVGNTRVENKLLVVIRDKKGSLVSLPAGHYLEFNSDMPDMGHGLDDPGYFDELDKGIYINKFIVFSMGGEWTHELEVLNESKEVKGKVTWDESL